MLARYTALYGVDEATVHASVFDVMLAELLPDSKLRYGMDKANLHACVLDVMLVGCLVGKTFL